MALNLDFCPNFIVVIYNFINTWSLNDMCPPLPLCCSDNSEKCKLKIISTEEVLKFEFTILVSWVFVGT